MASKIRVSLVRRNASKREKLVMGFVIMSAMVFLWIGGTAGMPQPNLTTVEALSETQIEVTWQPFDHVDDNKPHVYELYIDDYLEYFGNDVIYIARRLTPDTMYHFKLRSCVRYNERQDCSMFSKTLSGTTNQSRKRGFTKSFFQWAILCLFITFLASTTALLGRKITRRLWRSFLYRYDFCSDTNLQLPKYAANTDTVDEDVTYSLCLKTPEKVDATEEYAQSGDLHCKEQACMKDLSKIETKNPRKFGKSVREILESTELASNADVSKVESNSKVTEIVKSGDCFEDKPASFVNSSSLQKNQRHGKDDLLAKGPEYVYNLHLPAAQTKCKAEHLRAEDEETHLKNNESHETPKFFCASKADDGNNLTIQRAHTSPKLKTTKNSKQKKQSHRRTLSLDNNVQNTNEISGSVKITKYNAIQNNPVISCNYLTDLVVVVDNSNIFIGAQECSTFLYPNERKRNIRVKIQQLVKVFQRGRIVSRAFVQGSSPPTTEQVWEVYRHLGYCVDVEDRRGKDEQRVDEGLHLHIYKALFELSPRTLVIASGDGNKGKSECSTSLPGCAKAAIERGWKVEIHSWQHSTSMEWIKLSKKYPELLSICYLDRFLDHITYVDGKYGRKCQPFPANAFKHSSGNLN